MLSVELEHIQQDLKEMENKCQRNLLQDFIQERLDTCLERYNKELTLAYEYLSSRQPYRLCKRINRSL